MLGSTELARGTIASNAPRSTGSALGPALRSTPETLPGLSPRRGGGPRPIAVIGLTLVLITIVAAAVAAIGMAQRVGDLETMVNRTEPLATASENLYASLSQADASAASAFLSGGLESPTERQNYDRAIEAAASALATAASGASANPADQRALGQLATQLPVYTGLVDTARADNRLGLPVGAGYLREASGLMRGTLLPAAQQLYASESAAVTATQNSAGALPWWQVGLGVLTLAALLIGQRLLGRITRRRLNLGLLLAAAATLGWVVWLGVAGAGASSHLADSQDQGSIPLQHLVQARIVAQQARTDETLYLIARGSGDANEKLFGDHSTELQKQLAAAVTSGAASTATDTARAQATEWIASHKAMIATATNGDYPGAVAAGTGPSAIDFAQLDTSLQQAIADLRDTLRTEANQADSALSGLAAGIAALAVLAAIGVAVGLWPRLREYQ